MHLNDFIIFYPKYDEIKYIHTYKTIDDSNDGLMLIAAVDMLLILI